MRNFTGIGNTDVLGLRLELDRHPDLWNANGGRTGRENSPHSGVDDIWLRWRNKNALCDENGLDRPERYNEPFAELEWYPAINVLPAARFILMEIMGRVRGVALGGALITRIPPGGEVSPHSDAQSWHANYYNLKVYTTIQSNTRVTNLCAGESMTMAPGSCWSFDNRKEHAVYNRGDTDRVTLIAAIRCD